jgi:hypothetical protein
MEIVSYLRIMFYSDIEKMNSTQFKRLTGAKREAFNQMLEVVNESKACSRKHPSRSAPAK